MFDRTVTAYVPASGELLVIEQPSGQNHQNIATLLSSSNNDIFMRYFQMAVGYLPE